MTSELTEFLDTADETAAQWLGLVRSQHDEPVDAQVGLIVSTDEDFESLGMTLVAMASAGNDLGHVAVSIHAFVDGVRVSPAVMTLGDETIITIQNA